MAKGLAARASRLERRADRAKIGYLRDNIVTSVTLQRYCDAFDAFSVFF